MKNIVFLLVTIISINCINAQNSRNRRSLKEVGQYDINKKKTGVWKFYSIHKHPIRIAEYLDGKPNGITKLYNEYGQLKSILEYENGKLNGTSKSYFEDGQISGFTEYVNDKRHGESKSYWRNGKLSSIGKWTYDYQHGVWKEYFENGQLKEIGEYVGGLTNGVWKNYNEQGQLTSTRIDRAGSRAFHKFVFLETTLNYSQINKELLLPTENNPLRACSYNINPNKYTCAGAGGASYTFIEKSGKPDDFKVAVFHPTEKSKNSSVIVTSFVENGKVTQQSHCFYTSQWNPQEIDNESHYIINKMECYVVTAELSSIIDELKTKKDLESEEKFKRFVSVLKSRKYKQELLEAYKFNFNKAFLNVNRDEDFEFYSKLDRQFYNIVKENKDLENIKFPEYKKFEIGFGIWQDDLENYKTIYEVIDESKSLYEVYRDKKALFSRVYLVPSKNLLLNNLMTESKSE